MPDLLHAKFEAALVPDLNSSNGAVLPRHIILVACYPDDLERQRSLFTGLRLFVQLAQYAVSRMKDQADICNSSLVHRREMAISLDIAGDRLLYFSERHLTADVKRTFLVKRHPLLANPLNEINPSPNPEIETLPVITDVLVLL